MRTHKKLSYYIMSERIRKVNSVIQHELTTLITREVDFKPGVFVTLTRVETMEDLTAARVYIGVFPSSEEDYCMKTLGHEHYTLQKQLHKKLHLKILPKIEFIYDERGETVDELSDVLKMEDF